MKIGNKHFCLRNSFTSDGRSALGVSPSLNSHTCIHRGHHASPLPQSYLPWEVSTVYDHLPHNMSELSFPLPLLSNT